MRHRDQTIRLSSARLALSLALAAGCAPSGEDPAALNPLDARPQGRLQPPTTVWEQSPRAHILGDESHGYLLPGKAHARVTARLRVAESGFVEPALHLFGRRGPGGDRGSALAVSAAETEGDPSSGAVLEATLPYDSDEPETEYLLVVSAANAPSPPMHYRLDVTCDGPCDVAHTLEETRISRDEIAAAAAQDATPNEVSSMQGRLDAAGAFLFQHVFRISDGLGNGMIGGPAGRLDRPNMRLIHNGPFGGPDSQSCVSCHFQGGTYGSGPLDTNMYQAGDGESPETALVRNPPPLFGVGHRQAIAAAITKQLAARRDALAAQASATGKVAEDDLCIEGPDGRQPPCFGTLAVEPGGEVHTDGVVGIDTDLTVRPFGVKGREESLPGFVQGGYRVHFGMQAEGPIDAFCSKGFGCDASDSDCLSTMALYGATWGTPWPPQPCDDPDDDGVSHEITAGQLAATAYHLAALPRPPAAARCGAAARGEDVFDKVGCASCHVRALPFSPESLLDDAIGVPVLLAPAPAEIEIWSDFMRHDMGALLRDAHDFERLPRPSLAAGVFITPPLWALAQTAPYLHDGRAATIEDAILLHGGDAQDCVTAYNKLAGSKRDDLLAFLGSLGAPVDASCSP